MSQNSLDLVRYIIEKQKGQVSVANNFGSVVLTTLCSSEDADPKLVEYLLDQNKINVNFRTTAQTRKLKCLNFIFRLLVRVGAGKSQLLAYLTSIDGATALHYAVLRGDLEIVELLLMYGANPSIKNSFGRDVLS